MINLKDVIQDTKTAEIEYPNCKGFMVKVGLVTRPMANKIRKDCTVTKMSERYSSMEETIDEDKFSVEFTKAAVKGWSGLTGEHIKSLLPVDDSVKDEDDIPYSLDNAIMLVKNCSAFETWLNEVVFKLKYFRSE